jgi:hypothetical protein
MCTTAALLMLYTPICGSTRSPATEAMLTMRPWKFGPSLARAIICRATACATKNAPRTLVLNT